MNMERERCKQWSCTVHGVKKIIWSVLMIAVTGSAEMAGVRSFYDLAYVADGGARQKLDLFVPETGEGPWPVIVWVHGGAWLAGSKADCLALRQGLTQRGYAVASIGYRLSSDALFPAQIQDCKAAIRWLRAHAKAYHLDPARFGAWGSSAGGHLVALLGTSGSVKAFDVGENLAESSRVQAVCDYYGPTDLLRMDAHSHATARFSHDAENSPESRLIGGAIQKNQEKAVAANPITYVTVDVPPFLIVHGDADPVVPYGQSELLFAALKNVGAAVQLHTIQGAGHGQGFGGTNIDQMVVGFFDRCLKNATLPVVTATQTTSRASGELRVPAPARFTWKEVCRREGISEEGRVSRAAFKGPPQIFNRMDTNQDGFLTQEDFSDDTNRPRK